MQHRTGDLDLDHPGIHFRHNRDGGGHRLDDKRHERERTITRQDKLPLPGKTTPLRNMPRDQAILPGDIADPRPGTRLSATIRALTSSGHRRRPVGPSKTSMRETPLRLGTSIRCSIWCSTANLPQTQLQGGMPEIRLSRNHGAAASLALQLSLEKVLSLLFILNVDRVQFSAFFWHVVTL